MAEWNHLRVGMRDLPHEAEDEVRLLVTENHRITMRGIQQSEHEMVRYLRKVLAQEDKEIIASEVSRAQFYYEDLRRAANHMALVSLVTRLEHWTRKFVKQLPPNTELTANKRKPYIVRAMEALNTHLGRPPVDVQFFEDLVTARNAVVHHDSTTEWDFNGRRSVAARYNDCGDLNFTNDHLTEATKKVTAQVKWYDEQLRQ